jgi:ADP-heptose:LPS heptosyltransferase
VIGLKKILILRFSSIGDIVLTTPIVRCLYQQFPGVEIHFVTKTTFKSILIHNPYVQKVHVFDHDVSELAETLSGENFDLLIDLHKNLRSRKLKQLLKVKSITFDKINLKKFLAVNFKMLNRLPKKHIVDRYFEALKPIGLENDGYGLDYFISEKDKVDVTQWLPAENKKFVVLVIGGSYTTKKIPINKLIEICSFLTLPIILVGGKEDQGTGEQLKQLFPGVIDTSGRYNFNQSASIIQQCEWVISSDTGMMHIASAFNKKIISVWGNTVPAFGMLPYMPQPENIILEIEGLECRPCSKLGYKGCPLGHFKCMNTIDVSFVKDLY